MRHVVFLRHKLGCMPAKVIKSVLSDYYSTEAISGAKNQLMDDISRLDTDVILPHVPKRRYGDNRIARETDDIFTLFTVLDEQKQLEKLPRYVAESPDNMPSVRLYEGDLATLMKLVERMNGRIRELDEKLAAIMKGALCTRSSSVPLLYVPFRRTSFARRSFSTAAPLTWNSLPPAVLNCDSLSIFKSRLKTHLFSTAFC